MVSGFNGVVQLPWLPDACDKSYCWREYACHEYPFRAVANYEHYAMCLLLLFKIGTVVSHSITVIRVYFDSHVS